MEFSGEVQVGQVVLSKAGRDKGRVFLISEVVDPTFVKVVDGDLRKLEKPKLKQMKHLAIYNMVISDFSKAFSEGRLKDSDVRKFLEPYGNRASDGR